MFFYASKIFYFFIAPSHFLILCGLAGLITRWVGWKRIGGVLVVTSICGMAIVAFSPISLMAALPLEERFQAPDPMPETVDGIIVLGGSVNTRISSYRDRMTLVDSAERIADTAALARLYPDARVVFSGGSASIVQKTVTEASIARRYLESFGIDPSRLVIEDKARNTWENAVLSKDLAKPEAGETWILVTSAFHMPRSVGVFRRAGWSGIVPFPVDYRVGGPPDTRRMRTNAGLSVKLIDLVVKEWIGLAVYRLTGRSSALFPGP
ncbi:MAG: YdcF family protein [Pseudomonadota bacterium]